MDKEGSMAEQKNEGEGNKTAARHYNEKSEEFAKSGKVDRKAREAAEALDGDKGEELRRAEREGKSHAKGEDPQLKTGSKRSA
jgi:hypothetical protein